MWCLIFPFSHTPLIAASVERKSLFTAFQRLNTCDCLLSTHADTSGSRFYSPGFARRYRGACRAGGGSSSSVFGGPTSVSVCAALGKMAEAAAVPPHRFFCHCCKGEVNPKLPVRQMFSSWIYHAIFNWTCGWQVNLLPKHRVFRLLATAKPQLAC